ncbi:hypothetical protein CPB84DRAFT_1962937 [Gymnopilus junonius]|uniref:F-box domain-containing protein n=1 Tax=Gymnopilus junonius TaxID=109634 RepID=A0A9P5NNZ9_GYMJU|nr:hypothetical protein CPB84DRAFT_1962937 [Gymnopilus junonius]
MEVVKRIIEEEDLILPLELIIDILQHLDNSTLAKCAAVCRTWLVLTRPSLFTHLVLTKDRQIALSSQFSDLFSHPLSTIPSLVTSLTIMDPQNKELHSKVFPLLNALTNVRYLEIRTVDVFRTSGDFSVAIPTNHFRNLTMLKIDTDFPEFSHLVTFICDFPLLESLDMDTDWSGPATITSTGSLSSYLRTLQIRSLSQFILPWFLALPNLPPIEDIELLISDDLELVNQLIRMLGPSVRRLTLMLWDLSY